jgi:pyruvate kinase
LRQAVTVRSERMRVLHSAVVLANSLPGSKLLTFTRYGTMVRGLAALRPVSAPILAFTPTPGLHRQMQLLRAVEPFLMTFASEPDITIENAIIHLRRLGRVAPGDKLIVATDILSQDRLVESVQLRTVQ